MNRNSGWYAFLWMLILFVCLSIVGKLVQGINQPLEAVWWLVNRWGYPYFQAIAFSTFSILSVIVFSRFIRNLVAGVGNGGGLVLSLARELLRLAPEQIRGPVWKILWTFSVIAFVASVFIPDCLPSNAVIVTFDIFENGMLTSRISSGETIARAPGSNLEIEAKFEAGAMNSKSPRMDCKWATYTGDGRLIQGANCKINYRTGSDESPDPVAVTVTQNGCLSSLGYFSFFVRNGPVP